MGKNDNPSSPFFIPTGDPEWGGDSLCSIGMIYEIHTMHGNLKDLPECMKSPTNIPENGNEESPSVVLRGSDRTAGGVAGNTPTPGVS
jgi:hypothetical protein